MNYYDILGVTKDATREEIDKAYKILVKENQPEKRILDGEGEFYKAMEALVIINEAYKALTDPVKRKKIDKNPKAAEKALKTTRKKYESLFETTIRFKIDKLKEKKIKSIRERQEELFTKTKSKIKETREKEEESGKVETVRERIERKQREALEQKDIIEEEVLEETVIEEDEEEKYIAPDELGELLEDDEEIIDESYPIALLEKQKQKEYPLDKVEDKKKQREKEWSFYDKQELFYNALRHMEKKEYKEAFDLFNYLTKLADSYPYIYIIKACECAFFLGYNNYILIKTLEAMRAYISQEYLTFLLDKPKNHIFKILIELFFQNFALCSTKKKVHINTLLAAEEEVFNIVKHLSKTNPKVVGYASLYSAIAYIDLSELYREKKFILKALEKLNYVPEENYEKKTVRRINRVLKKFFKRKEVKTFRKIFPVLRAKNTGFF